MGFFDALSRGLVRSREALNEVFYFGGEVDEDFWEDLEDTLVMGDMGAEVAIQVSDDLRETAAKKNLKTAPQLRRALAEQLEQHFVPAERDPFADTPSCVLFVGINGAGKTTTVGKIASAMAARGKNVMIGSADTFRAAASEQLELWAERADVPLVQAGMGADPAAVIFDAVKSANARGYDMVIADTAGRLHNKKGLMDELSKISRSVKKASPEASLEVLLVLDAITGQNAISQAEEFCKAANATGVVLTKLDGTPRGGCAVSVWENLGLPIRFIGVGEKIDDLMEFDAQTFVESLLPESALQKDGEKEEGESEA